jgi:hypothetical protein
MSTSGAQGSELESSGIGSRDGEGAGDHDEPYQVGRRPRADSPFPFTPQQFARLLMLRGRIADGAYADDKAGRSRQSRRCKTRIAASSGSTSESAS